MDEHVTTSIGHMAKSHQEMARLLASKRESIVKISHIITAMPNENLGLGGARTVGEGAIDLTKSVTAYLNSIADLADAIADNMETVMKEMTEQEEHE